MLKEADVSKKGLLAFRECLSVVSSLTIDSIEELPAKDIPDYQAIVRGEGFKQIIYLEVNYHPLKRVASWFNERVTPLSPGVCVSGVPPVRAEFVRLHHFHTYNYIMFFCKIQGLFA